MLLLIWGEIFRSRFRRTGVKGVCSFMIFGSDWRCSENAIKRVMQKQLIINHDLALRPMQAIKSAI